jgi:hypothetical protein
MTCGEFNSLIWVDPAGRPPSELIAFMHHRDRCKTCGEKWAVLLKEAERKLTPERNAEVSAEGWQIGTKAFFAAMRDGEISL